MNKLVYVGFGANLGDPIEQILQAQRLLRALKSVRYLESSSFYVSSPVGYSDQPDFINCVARLQVTCCARELLSLTQEIESALGRQRDPDNQNAARLLDIDLLWFDNQIITEPDLIIPHPRMHQRRFVLEPLKELDHGLAKQVMGKDRTEPFDDQDVHRLTL